MCEMLCQETHTLTASLDRYLCILLTIMDGREVCACAGVRVEEQKNKNASLSRHPSHFCVYKDNLTPANAMRQLVFECTHV